MAVPVLPGQRLRYYLCWLLIRLILTIAFFFQAPFALAQNHSLPPFRFGINFPFRSPETAPLATYLRLLHEAKATAMRQLTFADVHWVQVEPENDAWNFARADSAINNSYGIASVPTFYHISASPQRQTPGLQVPWRACYDPDAGCGWDAARDSSDSRDYVQTVVRRYKARVKYWEISNEMSGKMRRPLGLPMDEFVAFLHMNYRWIKEIDPEAKVLNPGLPGTYGLPMAEPRRWLRDLLAASGVGSFDILSYHDYNSWWTLPAHFDSLKAMLAEYGLGEMPIWCTESSISSDPGSPITPNYASEDEQAADVWRRPAVLFARGLQVYFWHSLWSSGGTSPWREFGIVSAQGKKKKAFHAFRLLIEKLNGFREAYALSFGQVSEDNRVGGEGAWVVEFRWPDGSQKWVAWSPDNRSFTLRQLKANILTVTTAVPTSISNDGETATFDVQTITATGDSLQLQLHSVPVLMEENRAVGIHEKEGSCLFSFSLAQNRPNPFNPRTTIEYQLAAPGEVELAVYDITGRRVRTLVQGRQSVGLYTVHWDGHDEHGRTVASGIYLCRLKAGQRMRVRPMVLLR